MGGIISSAFGFSDGVHAGMIRVAGLPGGTCHAGYTAQDPGRTSVSHPLVLFRAVATQTAERVPQSPRMIITSWATSTSRRVR